MPDLFVAKSEISKEKKPHHNSISPSVATPPSKSTTSISKPKKVPMFASFTEYPENLEFEHQEPNEKIYLFLRKHFITNLKWILTTIIGAILPLGLLLLLPFFEQANLLIPGNYLFILGCFYYLILLGYSFINFITWYYNVGIITNLRVVDIDIAYITSKNVAATGLGDLVDVEYSQSGFLHNLYDYGNVHMQTEGLKANFEFLSIPKPAKTTDIITDLMREAKNE